MKKRLAIFKAGTHRAENGRTYTFSEGDVAAIAAAYDPSLHQAPSVLGHPKNSAAPAWGWAGKLEAEDGVLFAEGEQIDQAFAEGVDAGRYRFVSAAFYDTADPANPKPGVRYLRHVGFLGAQPPAIKGLGPAFNETAGADFIAFGQADGFWAKDLFRGLRDWIIDKFDLETADKVLPTYAIDNVDRSDKPAFAEAAVTTDDGAAEAAALARAAELDAREAAVAVREAAATSRDQAAFAESAAAGHAANRVEDAALVDQLVAGGKLPPGHADDVKSVLGVLAGDTTISFAEGEPSARDRLRTLLGGLGEVIQFAELAPGGDARFAEGRTPEQHASEIRAVMDQAEAQGRNLSAAEAAATLRNR
jgi:hypothetical protein